MADDRNENDTKMKSQSERIDDNQQWWLRFVPNTKHWSDVNISRFLSIYKTYPVLWDPTHSFYKDQPRRIKTYSIIARRLNLYGIKEQECMKLVESLRDLFTEEKTRQTIAERCSQKYTPPPPWYRILKEIIECVQQKLANPIGKESSSMKATAANLWEACCPRLYTEDIWTPEHFKTNIMDWFVTTQDEQRLLCTCQQFSESSFDDSGSTETSSKCYGDSTSESSRETNQCITEDLSHSTKMCCFNSRDSKLLEQYNVDANENKMQTCNDRKLNKREKTSICKSHTVNNTLICGDKKKQANVEVELKNTFKYPLANRKKPEIKIRSCCSETMYSGIEDFDFEQDSVKETCCEKTDYNNRMPRIDNTGCKMKKRKQNWKKKLVICKDSEKRITIGKEEGGVLDVCEIEAVQKPLNGIYTCQKNNTSFSCSIEDQNKSSHCRREAELNEQQQCDLGNTTSKSRLNKSRSNSCDIPNFRSCEPKKLPKYCTVQATTCGNNGSFVSSKSETSSSTESHDTCCSGTNKIPDTVSDSSSQDSPLLTERRLLSEKEKSDHRLDYYPDPTLCEKCAADRVPVPDTHKNVTYYQDPRTPELDRYCRYKDWDMIYNIRTQVPDKEPITIQIDEDLLLMMRYKNEPPRPKRKNHFPTEADVNLFIDPKSSEARQVSLNNEYKWECGSIIRIDQPRHYACEVFEVPGHKPAQLIL